MEEMNTIEMQAQESAAGTAGYAESTAPAGPEAPQGDLGGADNEGTGARRQTPEENARFAAMRRRQEAQQREERLFHELVGDARNPGNRNAVCVQGGICRVARRGGGPRTRAGRASGAGGPRAA